MYSYSDSLAFRAARRRRAPGNPPAASRVACRVEGAVTRPSPHRSGHEQYAHPVLQEPQAYSFLLAIG